MSDKLLLVDFENIPELSRDQIPAGVSVPFFLGASQRKVSSELLEFQSRLRERFILVRIEGHGRNALDFHIAFYLGEYLTKAPTTECVILSRDKGFDPLVRHLRARGFAVRRVAVVGEAFPVPSNSAGPSDNFSRVLQLLSKVDKGKRPRKRKTLLAQIRSYFPTLLSEEAEALLQRLESEQRIAVTASGLTYLF